MVLKIKSIKQIKYHCGPACIEMILKYYGINKFDQKEIGTKFKVKIIRGCYPYQVIKYLKRFGILAEKRGVWEGIPFDNLKHPIIVGTKTHFLLFIGRNKKKKLVLIDPAIGKRIYRTMKYFYKEIKDYIVIKEKK